MILDWENIIYKEHFLTLRKFEYRLDIGIILSRLISLGMITVLWLCKKIFLFLGSTCWDV